MPTNARILFPDRAEDIRNNIKLKQGYRVFLNHWPEFITFLKRSFERVVTRQASFALTIYGAQGVGKTLLADKLKSDYEETKKQIQLGKVTYDGSNLWHLRCPKECSFHIVNNHNL